MGTFVGHIAPGLGFLLIGCWHLFNTVLNYAQSPCHFETMPWFPVKSSGKLKYGELFCIIFGSLLSIASELFIGPRNHQPFAQDWSIPPQHLNNFEHSTISLFLLIYASVALITDAFRITLPHGFLQLLGAFAFSQEFLLFHLHSSDHMGLEGRYHWLLQLIIAVGLACTLLETVWPHSFLIALVRSMSILFQGCWFLQMGFVLWVPALTPRGCRLHHEPFHRIVRCDDSASTMRAKALANLQFSWYLAGLLVFTVLFLIFALTFYGERSGYQAIYQKEEPKDVQLAVNEFPRKSFDTFHSSVD